VSPLHQHLPIIVDGRISELQSVGEIMSDADGKPRVDTNEAINAYLDRVKELVPAEITAAFLAINTAIPLQSGNLNYLYGFFALLVIACWLYLRRFKKVTSFQQLIFVTLIAFPIWALNIAIARYEFLQGKEFIPSCALILITVFAPLFAGPKQDSDNK
jgi:hypothetical protein